jgi:hypothetical protein
MIFVHTAEDAEDSAILPALEGFRDDDLSLKITDHYPAALTRAKARLDGLMLYEQPVRIDRVRVVVASGLFRLPWFRRFDAYAMWNLILLRSPELEGDDELICHELCHVWQMQHRPVRMPLSYLRFGYAENPYEAEARRAAASPAPPRSGR